MAITQYCDLGVSAQGHKEKSAFVSVDVWEA